MNIPSGWDKVTGVDEVGRGSLAGPLFAAATTFHRTDNDVCPIEGVKDSKQFNSKEEMRRVYHRILRSPYLVDVGVGISSVHLINQDGIEWANSQAFRWAIDDLLWRPGYTIVDGMKPIRALPYKDQLVSPKADALYWQVGAASIIAKVLRDELMADLAKEFPAYGWESNCGYGAKVHKEALKKLGATPHHRLKFIEKLV